jgi:hypothetical protein
MIKFLTASIAVTVLSVVIPNVLGTKTEVRASSSQVATKGDRIDKQPNEPLCGDWPFYHHACLVDPKNSDRHARKVRVKLQANRRHPTFLTLLSR